MSLFPQQSPPLKRPRLIPPHSVVDIEHGRPIDLFKLRMDLLHGANFNDPEPLDFAYLGRQGGGCQRCVLRATGILA